MTPRSVLLAALLAALVAGCDFTPSLDIDVPEFEPAAVVNAVLAVDSVATVRVGVSRNPYRREPDRYGPEPTVEGATVTLLRDGQPVETLAIRSVRCEDFNSSPTGEFETYECGPYVGTVPVAAGARYTVRVEVSGLPTAEGTVTMPRRPVLTAEELPTDQDQRREFRVRLDDPAGRGDLYGIALLRGPFRYTATICDRTACRDTLITEGQRFPTAFDTSDPVILAAARELPDSGVSFAAVTDETFDGQAWTFRLTANSGYRTDEINDVLTLQIAGLSGNVYDAYLISAFGGLGDENPFAEPVNLPSNVRGGLGVVGGVALAEVSFGEPPSARR